MRTPVEIFTLRIENLVTEVNTLHVNVSFASEVTSYDGITL